MNKDKYFKTVTEWLGRSPGGLRGQERVKVALKVQSVVAGETGHAVGVQDIGL